MKYILFLLSSVVLFSCGTEAKKQEETTSKEFYALIQTQEDNLSKVAGNERKMAGVELINQYKIFAEKFPQDSATAEYLFRAGREEAFQGNFESSLRIYERILKHYPDYINAGNVAFMIAFTYDAHLGDFGKAQTAYSEFIEAYPDHRLVEDAKVSMEHLGLSDEDLLKKLQSQNNEEAES